MRHLWWVPKRTPRYEMSGAALELLFGNALLGRPLYDPRIPTPQPNHRAGTALRNQCVNVRIEHGLQQATAHLSSFCLTWCRRRGASPGGADRRSREHSKARAHGRRRRVCRRANCQPAKIDVPLRPELRPLYFPHWLELRQRVCFELACARCQGCGRPRFAQLR
jgi:hypothetical protein